MRSPYSVASPPSMKTPKKNKDGKYGAIATAQLMWIHTHWLLKILFFLGVARLIYRFYSLFLA